MNSVHAGPRKGNPSRSDNRKDRMTQDRRFVSRRTVVALPQLNSKSPHSARHNARGH